VADIKQAAIWMQQGKHVGRLVWDDSIGWEDDALVWRCDNHDPEHGPCDLNGAEFIPELEDLLAEDWEDSNDNPRK